MFRLLGILLLILSMSSCATVFSGTKDAITFNSEPPGAIVIIDGVKKGTTPCKIKVSRSSFRTSVVEFQKEGYASQYITLNSKFNRHTFWNLIGSAGLVAASFTSFQGPIILVPAALFLAPIAVIGIVGLGVDWATGAMYKYKTNYSLILVKNQE